ncbi:D-glycerate dehydrogenase [Magnetospira thiophila]
MSDHPPVLLVTRTLPKPIEEQLQMWFEPRLNGDDAPYEPDEIPDFAADAAGIVVTPTDRINAEVIAALDDTVRIIATFSVGFEHIDLAAAQARGIVVTHTPGVLTEATADMTLLLLLGAARRVREGDLLLRSGEWKGWCPTQLQGLGLQGRRLGILGMGRIGQAVARRARAFGMTLHYHNRHRLPADAEQGATYHATPEDLLAVSDVLSLHCPLTPETRGFLDARRLALLPPGAVVINTARGPVVDDDALIAALGSGRLAAAGLDVYDGEPHLHPGYLDLPNAFLMPHLGSATVETRLAMGQKVIDNLRAFFAGTPPPDRIA